MTDPNAEPTNANPSPPSLQSTPTTAQDPTPQTTTTSTQDPTTSEPITYLRPNPARQKPDFSLLPFQNGSGDSAADLKKRLSAFLPEIAAANEELERLGREGGLEGKRLEDVGEGEEYVEMELGLGVLEGKKGDDNEEEGESSSEEDDDDDDDDESSSGEDEVDGGMKEEGRDIPVRTRDGDGAQGKEKDVLGRLMGYKNGRGGGGAGGGEGQKAPGIQEVE